MRNVHLFEISLIKGLFEYMYLNDRFPYPFIYLRPGKNNVPIQADPPCIRHFS